MSLWIFDWASDSLTELVDLGSESLTCGPDLLGEKVPNRTKVPNGKVVLTDKF